MQGNNLVVNRILSRKNGLVYHFINKQRRDLEPILGQELVEWAGAFLRIRHDIFKS